MNRMILTVKCSQLCQITINKSKASYGYKDVIEIQTLMKNARDLVFCVSHQAYLFHSDSLCSYWFDAFLPVAEPLIALLAETT